MRINRLDLTRYGRFTDHVLDFGATTQGQPDLHIIYGPNEAGKSTTFSAFLDLLFGIEHASRYNFLHPYPAMQIGASLQLQGTTQELVRTKARKNSLSDGEGRSLPDMLITSELGEIDRNAYRMMFSLDDDTLEEGGEAILASKGNLGELLFSASAGLAGLSQSLTALRTRADQFYRHGARSGQLAELRARLQEIEAAKAEMDGKTSAQAYGKLADAHQSAENNYQQSLRTHSQTRSRIAEIEAMLNALPHYHNLQRLREQLEAFNGVPVAPAGLAAELPRLTIDDAELRTRREAQATILTGLEQEIVALKPDENALRRQGSLGSLQILQAAYQTAAKELPLSETALRAEQQAIEALLIRLGQDIHTDPRKLLIPVQAESTLRSLIERRSGIDAALKLSAKELANAQERADMAQDKLAQMAETHGVLDGENRQALIGLLSRLRGEDHFAYLRQAQASVGEEEAQLLALWQALPFTVYFDVSDLNKAVQELAVLPVPDMADAEAVMQDQQAAETRLAQLQDILAKYAEEHVQLQAQLQALQRNNQMLSQTQITELRKRRDAAWQEHRRMLNQETAQAFELLLAEDDLAAQNRLMQAAEFARAAQLRERIAVLDALTAQSEKTMLEVQAELKILQEHVTGWQNRILPDVAENIPVTALLRWLEKRNTLLAKSQQWQRACRLRDERLEQMKEAEQLLCESLEKAGCTVAGKDLAALQAMAEALNETYLQRTTLQTEADARALELHRRRKEGEDIEAQDAQWQQEWRAACGETWLGQEAVPALDQVREVLNLTNELAPRIHRAQELAQQIADMQQDQTTYRHETEALARHLGLPLCDAGGHAVSVSDLAHNCSQMIRKAEDEQQKLLGLQGRLAEAEQQMQNLNRQGDVLVARKEAMLGQLQADSLEDAVVKLQAAEEKARLEQASNGEEQTLLRLLRLAQPAEAETMLAQADSSELKIQLQTLHELVEAQDQVKQENYRLWKQAEQALQEAQAGDDSAARLDEQRRTLLLEIEEQSKQYLRLRFGVSAAEQALRLYRDQHRSSMMARASQAFAAISQGSYRQLTTQTDKDNEILIAVAADGSSKTAEQLSKGTRFQLYLALRVAGYYEFVAQRPMPFIADDIMETFDDARSRETFRIFSQMAQSGQVIYLTHHQHLCDIAREVCPQVRLHSL